MKKLLLLALLSVAAFLLPAGAALSFTVDAASSILIDAHTGKILFQENANQALPPASLTKMLTALVAIEKMPLSEEITVPPDFVNPGEAGIWLRAGETHTLENLLYAMLLNSANDAAAVIAIGVAGSEDAFVKMMNERSAELGLNASVWKNPHGLYQDGHLSSAYDLAIIARTAMQNTAFQKIVSAKEYTMPWIESPGDSSGENRELFNRNQFLALYEGANGIKTGQTTQSGPCLTASVVRGNMHIIGVLLNSDKMYTQMAALMDYGFETFEMMPVGKAGEIFGTVKIKSGREEEANVMLPKNMYILVPKEKRESASKTVSITEIIEAPAVKGLNAGKIIFSDGEGYSIESELVLAVNIERFTFWGTVKDVFRRMFGFLIHPPGSVAKVPH
jgi:D-alanyl-D-alanine carboxypeptidase (penicillin-binding protein 5/6)